MKGGAAMPVIVNLDVMVAKRKMGLTELSSRAGVTLANLSVRKSSKAILPVR